MFKYLSNNNEIIIMLLSGQMLSFKLLWFMISTILIFYNKSGKCFNYTINHILMQLGMPNFILATLKSYYLIII